LDERVQNALVRAGFGQQAEIKENEKGPAAKEDLIEDGIGHEITLKSSKRYFHLTIEEAIATAQS
jgi:hypothetical protein